MVGGNGGDKIYYVGNDATAADHKETFDIKNFEKSDTEAFITRGDLQRIYFVGSFNDQQLL